MPSCFDAIVRLVRHNVHASWVAETVVLIKGYEKETFIRFFSEL